MRVGGREGGRGWEGGREGGREGEGGKEGERVRVGGICKTFLSPSHPPSPSGHTHCCAVGVEVSGSRDPGTAFPAALLSSLGECGRGRRRERVRKRDGEEGMSLSTPSLFLPPSLHISPVQHSISYESFLRVEVLVVDSSGH